MNTYLLVKAVHIVSSVLLVGTGFGTSFFLYFANRTRLVEPIAVVARLVVRADWWFTTPTAIIQPLTGLYLVHVNRLPLTTSWIALSAFLFVIAGACWLPVVWLQLQLARMAGQSVKEGTSLPQRYWRYAAIWEWLGYPAFAAMLVIFFLMVFHPTL